MKLIKNTIWLILVPFLFGFTNIAHRGDNQLGKYVEHSYQAYDHALVNHADYLELDVQKTKDGILVISHDNNLGRIFGVDKDIGETNFNELRKYRNRADEPLHTLQEVFSRYKNDTNLNFMIETKNENTMVGMEKQLVRLIKKNKLENRVLFESFSSPSLHLLSKLAPEIPRTQLGGDYHNIGNNQYYANGLYDPITAKYLMEHGKGYFIWGIDKISAIKKAMRKAGVTGIITDFSNRVSKLKGKEVKLDVFPLTGVVTVKKPFALIENSYQILPYGSKVHIKYITLKNGQLKYGIDNNHWIRENDVYTTNSSAPKVKTGHVYINQVAPLWRDPWGNEKLGRSLRADSHWNYYSVSNVSGHRYFNLGGNQWIDGKNVEDQ